MDAIFVVGTGRSGTHFTARLLNGFENANDPLAGKEDASMLDSVAKAAIHHSDLPQSAIENIQNRRSQSSGNVLLDQHHPNLFFAQDWAKLLDNSVFLFVDRPTLQVVASMLRHRGVLSWYKYAQHLRQRTVNRLPYPNRFLGVETRNDIRSLPTHLLCAHRVFAHRRAFQDQVEKMNGQLRAISYESLVTDTNKELSRVFSEKELKHLGEFTMIETPKPSSLSKYKDVLSEDQVVEITRLEKQLKLSWNA